MNQFCYQRYSLWGMLDLANRKPYGAFISLAENYLAQAVLSIQIESLPKP
jgi:hypothetical protein